MAQRILGLDIGSWSIKAVIVESSLRKVSIVRFQERHLPVDATGNVLPGELPAALRALMAGGGEGRLDADLIITSIPGVQVLTREVQLPFADAKRIAPVLGFQLESQLPRPLDTVVYDWHLLRKNEEGALLLCPAADKAWLDGWLGELKAGQADPRTVTLSALALENVTPHLSAGGGTRVILDLGHRSSQLTLLKAGRFETFRALSRGGHHATLGLARTLGLAYADAEHIKHEGVRLDGETPEGLDEREHVRRARAVMQALEPLLRDIKVTIDGFRARVGEISDIVLIGGGARLVGIDQVLERMLEIPVAAAVTSGPMWEGLAPEVRASAIVPAAVALEHMADGTPHRVNLRRGDLAYASDLGALRARAGWIVGFLVLIAALYFVRKQMRIATLEGHEAQLVERLQQHADKVLDEPLMGDASDPASQFAAMSALVTTPLENDADQVYPGMTAFRAFYDVSRIMKDLNDRAMPDTDEDEDNPSAPKKPPPPPTELKQVELTTFVADLKSLTLSGAGFDIVTIEGFVAKLKEHKCFKKVERLEAKKSSSVTRPGWTDFTIKIDVKCDHPDEGKGKLEADSGRGGGAPGAPLKTDKVDTGGKAGDGGGKAGDAGGKAGDGSDKPSVPVRPPPIGAAPGGTTTPKGE